MKQTHFERMLYNPTFKMQEVFERLKVELPHEGFSWEQFCLTDFIRSFASQYDMKSSLSTAHILFHTYAYFIGTGRTYEVTENIGEMLLNTKLDVDVSMVKSPFPEIQVLLPHLIQIQDPHTGMHWVSTLYINVLEQGDIRHVRICCVGSPNENSADEFDDAVYYFHMPLSGGKVMDEVKRTLETWKVSKDFSRFAEKADMDMTPRIVQLALNILLYITSRDADIRKQNTDFDEMSKRVARLKSTAKLAKVQHRLEKESRIPRYVIGSSIQLSSEEMNMYRSLRLGGKHSVRYPVGGHWRMQWYGPVDTKHQEQIWIRPHFRGPELAELVKSVGVLKGAEHANIPV